MPRVAKQTFATLCTALADAKAGDTVLVSTSADLDPTRYTIKLFTDTGGLALVGVRKARRELVIARAEKTVWLCNGQRARRVVQAWVEAGEKPGAVSPIIGDMRAAMYDTNAELGEARAMLKRYEAALDKVSIAVGSGASIGMRTSDTMLDLLADRVRLMSVYIDALRDVSPDVWALTGDDLDDSATLAVGVGRLVNDKRLLDSAHAGLGRKLDAVERERDTMSRSLCQLRNIASGVEPGTQPLPSNESPASVVVTVSAAMLRLACGSPPVRMPGFYRDAMRGALPERMQKEQTSVDPR
jgi:hypothetical protein